jgi:DNA-binding NarL/FixJ family response regulator
MNKITVLIAEDHETVREGLKLILAGQSDLEVVGDAGDGRAAIELAQKLEPDVVLMDISMPNLNGLKATAKLKECCSKTSVLALTRHKDDSYLQQILRAGASGYVLKQSPASELVHAIRAVASGGKYLDPAVVGKVMGSYTGRKTISSEPRPAITERETEVLRLISWGYSNKDIANRLDLSVKTVETHKTNAMKKLGMNSRIEIVKYAVAQGWMENQ